MSHCNLSGKSGSLSNTLVSNLNSINSIQDSTELHKYVLELVTSVNLKSNKSTATVRFINSLNRLKTVAEIQSLVYNTILSGDNQKVIN